MADIRGADPLLSLRTKSQHYRQRNRHSESIKSFRERMQHPIVRFQVVWTPMRSEIENESLKVFRGNRLQQVVELPRRRGDP